MIVNRKRIATLLLAAMLASASCGEESFIPEPIPPIPPPPTPYTEPAADILAAEHALEATVVLAIFSSADDAEAELRSDAAREIITQFKDGDPDSERVLDLLDTIAPGASINDRRDAARKLAELSETGDMGSAEYLEAAEEMSRLVTGNRLDAKRRIEAANELTRRLNEGDLDAESALDLIDDIAPETNIKVRAEALRALATEFNEDEWDDEKAMDFAYELHRLATGEDLNIEERVDATVDVSGEALKGAGKIVNGEEGLYGDEEIDRAGEVIKGTLRGDSEDVKALLQETSAEENAAEAGSYSYPYCAVRLGSGLCTRTAYKVVEKEYVSAYKRRLNESKYAEGEDAYDYAVAYVGQREKGKSHLFAHTFAEATFDRDWTPTRTYDFAEQIEQGKDEPYAYAYAEMVEDGLSRKFVAAYLRYIHVIGPEWEEITRDSRYRVRADGENGTLYAEQTNSGKSSRYVYYYIAGTKIFYRHISPITDDALRLSSTYARTYAEAYAELRDGGEAHGYAAYYAFAHAYAASHAKRHLLENPRGYTVAYAEQRAIGKSHEYSVAYAEQRALGKTHEFSAAYAEKKSKQHPYYDAFEEQLTRGGTLEYADSYARSIARGETVEYAKVYAEQIAGGRSTEYAEAYAEQIDEGGSTEYATAYSGRIALGIAPEAAAAYAQAYVEQTESGKTVKYADTYADFISRGFPPEYAGAFAEQIELGKSERHAHYYSTRIVEGESPEYAAAYAYRLAAFYVPVSPSDSIDDTYDYIYVHAYARAYAASYVVQIELGRTPTSAELYADSDGLLYGGTYADAYVEQIEMGKSADDAQAYAEQIAGKYMPSRGATNGKSN